jgi:oligopeptidase B
MKTKPNHPRVQSVFTQRPSLFICHCLLGATFLGSGFAQDTSAPIAKKVPKVLEESGHRRSDPYYWLKERENPAVIAYLKQENDYLNRVLAHTTNLQTALFDEIVGRIKKDDDTVPVRIRDYYYYTRFVEGGEYAIHCRKQGSLDAPEEIFLNENELAKGHEFFAFAGWDIHPGQKMAAFAVDTVGRRFNTIRFKNLETGEFLPHSISNVTENFVWAEDGKTLLYTRQDPNTLRAYQLFRHTLGTEPSNDVLVFEEKDETFSCHITRSKSRKYIFVLSHHLQSMEYRMLDAAKPESELKLIQPREPEHLYSVEHRGDDFYIRTNWKAKNHRLMKAPVSNPAKQNWQEVIPHRADVLLEGFEIFRDQLVLQERREGLSRLRVRSWDGKDDHYIEFDEPAYLARIGANPEMETSSLRYIYTSLTTPSSTYDYDMAKRQRVLRKRTEVLGGFDPADYKTERRFAQARDGQRVPISIVYRKTTPLNGKSPLLLYGYGSYGSSSEATFSSPRLSLLDRGFVFAIAHVRGGQEMGREWYESGRLLKKKNTFTDFIDCGEFLVKEGYADKQRLYAMGGSAGGLLMGAVVNLRPDLFHGVVAAVPFVDVVTTMLDDTIPLTTFEYEEWGNPNQKEYYNYMLSYSPYDNVEAKAYPNLLVTTGLQDSQVQYWEPAKWVAKLRTLKTDKNRLLLYTNMGAGHGGATGRFKRHRETAQDYAFLIDLAEKKKVVAE